MLKAPDVPSVLVELGYLSNAKDEEQLRNPEWRGKAADTHRHGDRAVRGGQGRQPAAEHAAVLGDAALQIDHSPWL